MSLRLMYITNNPNIAKIAQSTGVDRIWIDLETLGKEKRQSNFDSVKSHHSFKDINIIKPLLTKSKLLVRVNPINSKSKEEINTVIENGADIVMLPMFKTCEEIFQFIHFVNRRAKVSLLLETAEAEQLIDSILKIDGIDEIHIGLNDLHISHHLSFMFELITNGTIETLCKKMEYSGIPYGFGGIAKLGAGLIPSEKIIAEHYRLKSSQAILSRSFCNADLIKDLDIIEKEFEVNIAKIREFENYVMQQPQSYFINNYKDMKQRVETIININN